MPFLAEQTLQAVRNIPLYEIVRPHVELKRSGANWRGLSPFSNERTPSFYVLTDKNYFKCFSTGLAGDGIRFVQEVERMNFMEAVEALAERFQIPLEYAKGSGPDPAQRSLKQGLLDLHAYACEYYQECFHADQEDAAHVRDYWRTTRGFSMELANDFKIGFAPVDAKGLMQRLLQKQFPASILKESGLFYTGRNAAAPEQWLPVFRGRLMIPICDLQGQVVAFTARQLELTPQDNPSWKAKYINSPETPLFKKGHMLFNLDRAKLACRDSSSLLMVEGQLDALRCHAVGLEAAIAPQGTAVTEQQLSLIKRYADRLEVMLDRDDAGTRAILRLLPMAFRAQLEVSVYSLPEKADPDDFLRQFGRDGLAQLERQPGIVYAARVLLPESPTPEVRSQVLQQLLQMLVQCPSAIVRQGYIDAIADVLQLTAHVVYQEMERLLADGTIGRPQIQPKTALPRERKEAGLLTNAEGDLIWAILHNVDWAQLLAHVVDHQWIRMNTTEGRLLSRILNQALLDPLESREQIYAQLEQDEERDCYARYIVDDRNGDNSLQTVNNAVIYLFKQYCRERVRQLNTQVEAALKSNSAPSELTDLMAEIRQLNRQRMSGPFPIIPEPPVSQSSL